MSEKERFEAWAKAEGLSLKDFYVGTPDDPAYNEYTTFLAWEAWQAAQAAPVEPQKLEAQEPLKLIAPIAYATPPASPVATVADAEIETEQEMLRRRSFPERIWLSDGNNEGVLYGDDSNFEVTWCTDQQENFDILYVREDLATPPASPVARIVLTPEMIEAGVNTYWSPTEPIPDCDESVPLLIEQIWSAMMAARTATPPAEPTPEMLEAGLKELDRRGYTGILRTDLQAVVKAIGSAK